MPEAERTLKRESVGFHSRDAIQLFYAEIMAWFIINSEVVNNNCRE